MKDQERAFPLISDDKINEGITVRDYFAAKAMQGLLASPKVTETNVDILANEFYKMADAMIKQREL